MRALGEIPRGSSPLRFRPVGEVLPSLSQKSFLTLEAQECNRHHMGSEGSSKPGRPSILPLLAHSSPSSRLFWLLAGLFPSSHATGKESVEGLSDHPTPDMSDFPPGRKGHSSARSSRACRQRPSSPGLPFWGQVLATVSSEKGQNGVNRIARYCTARTLAVGFDLLCSTGHAALGGTITRPSHPAARQAHDYSGGG